MNTELTEEAAAECRRLGIGPESQADGGLFASDGEFMALFYNFAYGEVLAEASVQLDRRTRSIAILAALLGAQAQEEFAVMLCAALNAGVSAAEIKEIIYHELMINQILCLILIASLNQELLLSIIRQEIYPEVVSYFV